MALTWQQKLNQQYSSGKVGGGQVSETKKSVPSWQAKLNQQYKVSVPTTPSASPQITQQRQTGLAKFGITEPVNTPIKITAPEKLGGPKLGFEFTPNITDQSKIEARDIAESMKDKIRGGTWANTEEEVDHKIPVALGGTKAPYNLQALKSTKTVSQTFDDWATGKSRLPGEYTPQNRQEGKMIVEWDIIDKFESGVLTQGQAIYNILQYNWSDESAKNKIESNVLKGVQEWETNKQTSQPLKVTQPSAVDLATKQIKEGLKSALNIKPLLKGAGESVTMPLDFLHRTGLQVVNAIAPLYTTTVGALVKLSGNEDFKNISLDTIWKDSLEKAGDRMLGIGSPTEALKPLIGRQATPVAIPELEKIYEQQTVKLIEADKNYDVGKFLKEGAIMGFAKFTEDWANPFWLFDIKGFSAGSFKKDFGEKTIYEQSFQYNPAKEDFLKLKGKIGKAKEETGVFDINVKQNEDLNKVVAEISEKGKVTTPKIEKPPKLKGYITVKSTGDVNVKITNSGGEIFNKEVIKQIADKPKLLTAGEAGKEADVIFEPIFFKHPAEDIAQHINRAITGSMDKMTPPARDVLSIDLTKIKSIEDFQKIVTQTIQQNKFYQVIQDPATLKNIQFGIDTNMSQFYNHLNEPVMFDQWLKNGYITLAPKVNFGNIAPVVPSTAIKTGIKAVEEATKAGGAISKTLTEEAKKYKTPEEFIKTQPKLYRGSDVIEKNIVVNTDESLSYGKGVYLTDNPEIAKEYGKNVSNIYSVTPLKLKSISESERQEIVNLFGKEQDKYIKSLLGSEYDGFKIPEKAGDGNEIVIYNPDILKTESQLKQIWEDTTQEVPTIKIEQPLIEEAKKYKTAEEFVDNIKLTKLDDNTKKIISDTIARENNIVDYSKLSVKEKGKLFESELTNIWNKANQATLKQSFIQETRKGDYYTLVNAEGGGTKFLKAENAKPVKNKYGLDLFVSKNKDGLWVVSEAKSGKSLTGTMTTKQSAIDSIDYALQKAKERGYDVEKTINESVSKYGATPKYSNSTSETGLKAPSGGGLADIGTFKEGSPVLLGGIDKIRPIETPEMVDLVKELTGKVPIMNKRLRTKLGVFWGRGEGEIQLRPDIFKDPVQVAKTLAHEIGHLTDFLPKFGVRRSSLLQKLYIIKNHLNTEFGTELVKNKEIKNELWNLSTYWRPLGDNPSAGFLKYRNSANELYADAISVLFNSPGLLEQKAPIFYKQFFATLDNKPDINEKYWEIQDMLHGAKDELYEARENRIKAGFAKAEDIQKGFQDKKEKAVSRLGERLRQQLDDRYWPINKKVNEAEAAGKIIDDSANPKYLLQELPYINNENYLLVDRLNKEISEPVRLAGMNDDDIGIYLLLDRIQGSRADIANPYGFDINNSKEQLDYLRKRVGDDNFKLLQNKVAQFHDEVFKSVEKAVEVGSYNKEVFEKTIKPNKQNYATFAVVDYLQDYVPATVKKQVGTFKEVANPYHLTILKTAALNKLNALQEAKNSVRDLLLTDFPKEIARSGEIRSGKISIFKINRDKGQLQMLEDGKLKSYDVDPYIARSFKHDDPDDLNVSIKLLQRFNQNFKSLVTTYNLGFAVAFNPIRDFKRNYKNIPNASILNLVKAYVQSIPSAARYAKGKLDDLTKQMVADKLINAPIYDYNFDPRDDGMGAILEKYGVISRNTPESVLPAKMVQARKFLLKPVIKVLEAIRFTANVFENVSKVAATKIRIAGGETGKELAYNIRNFSGTPNWKVKGTQSITTNELFIFSNIMKEGIKSDLIIAIDPKTRSGYWWKSVKIDFLPKFLMFLAGAGIFGAKVKNLFDKMTEYDKTNYITIPIGEHNGKVVYARIPHDETGRVVSAILWKSLNFMKDRNLNGLQDILAVGAGQLPNVTPVITILEAWGQYLTGRNPYDSFRGRTLIDDTTFQAGGMAGLKKMVQWSANTFGLSQFTTYDPSKNDTLETTVQILPLINRLFKISDYGLTEQAKELQAEIQTQKARETLKDKNVINKYVKKYKDAYKAGEADIYDIGDQVVRDILGHDPETDDEYARDKTIRTRLLRSMKIGAYDSRYDSLIYATSNKEKVALLKKYQKDMASDDFNDLLETAADEKIISNEVYDQIKP